MTVLENSSFFEGERPIQTQVREFFAEERQNYIVEWGVRVVDSALILHFYPPKDVGGWELSYDMPKRLEHAIREHTNVDQVTCGFVDEYASFFVIAGGYGAGPDQRPFMKTFLDALDSYAS